MSGRVGKQVDPKVLDQATLKTIQATVGQLNRMIAAYLLDRADQYDTESPCWIALSDAAHNVANNEAMIADNAGELDPEIYARVDGFTQKGAKPKPVVPDLGVDDKDDE